MPVDHRRFDVAMPQELLNRSNIIAAFKDVRGKACRNVWHVARFGENSKGFDPFIFSEPSPILRKDDVIQQDVTPICSKPVVHFIERARVIDARGRACIFHGKKLSASPTCVKGIPISPISPFT